jgi:hypothetical protein
VTDMRDELLDRIVDELRTLPPVDEGAVARIAFAARGQRSEGGGRRELKPHGWWHSQVPLAAAAGFAFAAGLAGFLAGNAVGSRSPTTTVGANVQPSASLTVAVSAPPSALRPPPSPVPTQFVLDVPRASRVSLVGDFNGWDTAATPLARDPSAGIWTVTVPLTAGRHVYAFMVDGRVWTLDPRAPKAEDPDFGTPSSVVLIGAP